MTALGATGRKTFEHLGTGERKRAFGRLIVFVLCWLPAAAWLSVVPPMWGYIDSAVFVFHNMNMLVPSYAAVYPTVIRWIMDTFGVSDGSLYMLVVLQHGVFALSLFFLATYFPYLWQRIVLVLGVSTCMVAGVYVHGVYTEALFLGFLVFLVGVVVRIARHGSTPVWLWGLYGITLWLLISTRHPGPVFASVLPLILLIQIPFQPRIFRRFQAGKLLLSIAISVGAIIIANITTMMLCNQHDGVCVSTLGRSITCRIESLPWKDISADDRRAWTEAMKDRATDPAEVAAAESIMANADTRLCWMKARRLVKDVLIEKGEPRGSGVYLEEKIDKTLTAVGLSFYLTADKHLWKNVSEETLRYFLEGGEVKGAMLRTAASFDLYQRQKIYREEFSAVTIIDPKAQERVLGIANATVVSVFDRVNGVGVVLSVVVIGIVLGAFRAISPGILITVASMVLITPVYTFLVTLTNSHQYRYFVPAMLFLWIAASILVASGDWRRLSNEIKRRLCFAGRTILPNG